MKILVAFIALHFLSFYNCSLQAQWAQTSCPYGGVVHCFAVSYNNIFVATDNKGVFLSTDNGTNWTSVNNGLTNTSISSLAVSGTNVFAGTLGDGVFFSSNNGAAWTSVNNGLTSMDVYSLADSGNNVYAGTGGGGVYVSTNNGTNWTEGDLTNPAILSVAVMGNNIFAGGQPFNQTGGGVFLSTNNGLNWSPTVLNSSFVYALVVNGTNVFAATNYGVYLSTNNGANWSSIIPGLPLYLYFISLTVSEANIFAGHYGRGVYLSTDYGSTWSQANNGLTDTTISALAVSGNYVFAGTRGAGVWRRPLSELVGVTKETSELPKQFTLSQNFPNPFNPSTNIKYSIPKTSQVSLKVYNILGNEIKTIVNEEKPAGNYSVTFNASNLPGGIYFYKLEAGQFSQTKKMILLK